MARAYDHVQFLDVDTNRNLYTKHGLHFNKFGKVQLAKKLLSIVQLRFGKKIDPPMALGCPTPLLVSGDRLTVVNPIDIVEDQNESVHVDVSFGDGTANRTVRRKIAATTTATRSTSIQQNKINNNSNKTREISSEMSGNPLLNHILDSKSSRQSTRSRKYL
jgi:hypothetical protein